MTYNEIMTWTAFTILAMFFKISKIFIQKIVSLKIQNTHSKKIFIFLKEAVSPTLRWRRTSIGVSTALYTVVYTVYTLDTVYTFDMAYTVDMVHNIDIVYTVDCWHG